MPSGWEFWFLLSVVLIWLGFGFYSFYGTSFNILSVVIVWRVGKIMVFGKF